MKKPKPPRPPICLPCGGSGIAWLKGARGMIRRPCEKCKGSGVAKEGK